MSNLIPFDFNNHVIRCESVGGEPWFVANDICKLLEYSNSRKALADHCRQSGVTKRYISSNGQKRLVSFINEGNLYRLITRSKMPEAEKFEEKVFEEILPTIRKTGKYSVTNNVISIETRLPVVADDFVAAKKIAETMGLVGNQAVLSANVMTKKTTGVDVMELAEVKYLINEEQELTHTPTDLGVKFDMSAIEINKLLCGCGLQKSIPYKKGKKRWELTEKGREFGKYLDSGKKHSDGKPVMSIGWFETVLTELVKYGEQLKARLPMSVVSGFK